MNTDRGGQLLRSFLGIRNGREALVFDIDADAPAYASHYPSPLGSALCVFSRIPESADGCNEVVAQLIAGSGVPPHYVSVSTWLDSRPAGWWVLSHDIDNEVLSTDVIGPFDHDLSSYLTRLRDHQTVETDSRRLSFLSDDQACVVDYVWDSECFAVFLHASPDVIARYEEVSGR